MGHTWGRRARVFDTSLARVRESVGSQRSIIVVAAVLLIGHSVFRAWILFPSYFYADDFNLLSEATRPAPSLDYLFTTYNGHLMPAGRLVAWCVAQSGLANWPLAASVLYFAQILSALSALWMLVVLFGVRWAILAPLTAFLSTAMTVPSLVWWAAGLDFVGLQLSFFLAVGAWVLYLRRRTMRWLVLTAVAVALGLLIWVKALLLLPVLAYVALAYFEPGSIYRRPLQVARRYAPAAAVLGIVCIPYVAYYVAVKPAELFERPTDLSVMELLERMLGTTFATGALGGPWQWVSLTPPTAFADPPSWTTPLVWSSITLIVVVGALLRKNTGRGWVLLVAYLVALAALVTSSRAVPLGEGIGLEPRYVADATLVLTLVLGLVFMELTGAPGSSCPRDPPLLTRSVPAGWLVAFTAVVAIGGIGSSARYASYWHEDGARTYVSHIKDQLEVRGVVDLALQPVPDNVMSQLGAPLNNTEFLLPLVTEKVSFPSATDELMAVDNVGALYPAAIKLGVPSRPGPVDGCGWRVTQRGKDIPLSADAFDYIWWARIGYLSSTASPVTVSAGETSIDTNVRRGLNNLYVRLEGAFDRVSISGLARGTTLCVDVIEVGEPVPGGPLP